MSKQIKITISGPAGAGKTTVASLIRDALFKVGIHQIDQDETLLHGIDQEVRTESVVAAKPEVTIETVTTVRKLYEETQVLVTGPNGVQRRIE